MIPRETIDVLRSFNDVSVGLFGINCELRIPINLDAVEKKDVYSVPQDLTYDVHQTEVFIEWQPDMKRLRKIGVYTEDHIPIVAWFKNELPVIVQSYIKVPIEYIPSQFVDVDEFEIVDVLVRGSHDAIILKSFEIAPRRVKKKQHGYKS
jgi:hypothetical protein